MSHTMERAELITTLAEVIAGLQVPISISGELGTKVLGVADAPARKLLGLVGGWAKPEEFELVFKRILEGDDAVAGLEEAIVDFRLRKKVTELEGPNPGPVGTGA